MSLGDGMPPGFPGRGPGRWCGGEVQVEMETPEKKSEARTALCGPGLGLARAAGVARRSNQYFRSSFSATDSRTSVMRALMRIIRLSRSSL